MQIRTRTALSMWISLAAVSGMLGAIGWGYRGYRIAEENDALTNRIRRADTMMLALRDEYLNSNEERPRKLWFKKLGEMRELVGIARERLPSPGDRALLADMEHRLQEAQELFMAIVSSMEGGRPGSDAALAAENTRQLVEQLIMAAYRRSEGVQRLREANRARVQSAFRRMTLLTTLFVIAGSAAVAANARAIDRLVSSRIGALEEGTRAFAAGELDRRIIAAGDDELAALSQTFNAMAEKLQQSHVRLEAANKELEGFSYSISHDLRAPLRHIDSFVGLLLKRTSGVEFDGKARHYLDVISEAAKQMGRLVDDLLSFSRMGRVELKHSRVALDAVLAEVIESVKTEMPGREIAWTAQPLPEVTGDPAMLKIVLFNLVHNAAKYSAGRTPARIEIGQIPGAAEDTIFVRDNGVGFDMKYVDKLFGLFQRLHSAEEFPGTGLGLANVRRIVHRHGGRTWAEGAEGQGATFFFTLPKQMEG